MTGPVGDQPFHFRDMRAHLVLRLRLLHGADGAEHFRHQVFEDVLHPHRLLALGVFSRLNRPKPGTLVAHSGAPKVESNRFNTSPTASRHCIRFSARPGSACASLSSRYISTNMACCAVCPGCSVARPSTCSGST